MSRSCFCRLECRRITSAARNARRCNDREHLALSNRPCDQPSASRRDKKENSLHRLSPMSCGSSMGCLEKDDDSRQKRRRKGHKSHWHPTSLARTLGLTSNLVLCSWAGVCPNSAALQSGGSNGGRPFFRGGGSTAALFSVAARQNRRGCFDIALRRPKKPRAAFQPRENSNHADQLQRRPSQLHLRLLRPFKSESIRRSQPHHQRSQM